MRFIHFYVNDEMAYFYSKLKNAVTAKKFKIIIRLSVYIKYFTIILIAFHIKMSCLIFLIQNKLSRELSTCLLQFFFFKKARQRCEIIGYSSASIITNDVSPSKRQ